jgi:hypothetical protein
MFDGSLAAFVIGGGVLPGPLLAAIAERATVRELRHPGDAQPEPRYAYFAHTGRFRAVSRSHVSLPGL